MAFVCGDAPHPFRHHSESRPSWTPPGRTSLACGFLPVLSPHPPSKFECVGVGVRGNTTQCEGVARLCVEVAQAQHTLFRQLEAARQEVENLKAQKLQLLRFQQQIQASGGNISQQVSKIEQLQGLTQRLQGGLRDVKTHLEGLQVRVHNDIRPFRQWEERMAQELELRFRTEQTQVKHTRKSGIPIMCNPCGLVLMRWRVTKKRKPNPPELPSMI